MKMMIKEVILKNSFCDRSSGATAVALPHSLPWTRFPSQVSPQKSQFHTISNIWWLGTSYKIENGTSHEIDQKPTILFNYHLRIGSRIFSSLTPNERRNSSLPKRSKVVRLALLIFLTYFFSRRDLGLVGKPCLGILLTRFQGPILAATQT